MTESGYSWVVSAAALVGGKILKSKKTREVTVNAVAQAMKLHKDAQATFANIKEEAEDICFDAKQQAPKHATAEQ